MSDRGKKIFLGLSIAVPFLLYCVYYYGGMIKNAPYKFSEFQGITFRYGKMGTENEYNSQKGSYRYLNEQNKIILEKVHLSKNDLLYIHRKASDLGFWNFPEKMLPQDNSGNHFYIEMIYKRKVKKIFFSSEWTENSKIADATKQFITTVQKTINDAESSRKYQQ